MERIKSSIYSSNEVALAYMLADALEDRKSLPFYLSCAKKYPHDYILAKLNEVLAKPDHAVRTTRARIFTKIMTNSEYSANDHTWD